jgi:pepF/M3 family oligoendopeptidase
MNATPSAADSFAAMRWNTANIYSSLSGDDYRQAFAELEAGIAALEQAFNGWQIRRPAATSGESNAATDAALADVLLQALDGLNRLARTAGTLEAFIYAFVSTDSYDTLAARETSRLEVLDTRRRQLEVRLQGWLGCVAARLESLVTARPSLASHRFYLVDAARRSRYLMGEDLERLAAELCLDGATAFGKLQGNLTSQLKAPLERDGKTESLPVTVVHNFCFSADAALRERAYRAEVAAYDSIRVPIAASLNSVKGTALTLAKHRGRESVLAEALDDNRIDQATLDALLGAIREAFPTFRRYLTAKARKLGLARLRWWDLFAPVGESTRRFTWPEASALVLERFASFSDDMGRFAQRAFAERWIDVEPRAGKRGGAFCMGVVGVEESRILMNFDGSYEQVSTLAHELGHGYHNHCQTGLEPLRRGAPSTLAETASIFCETLLAEATLAAGDTAKLTPADRLAILESQLCGATQVCLDISSRFQFESALLERRGGGELSADEMCELMRAAQADTYADAVEPDTYHPYMWLWKPHYYQHAGNFYNFPYAFGQLFALGLYAVYRREGASFTPHYQQLLRSTGEELAAPLARRFGIDITGRDFWRASLALVAEQVDRYEVISG